MKKQRNNIYKDYYNSNSKHSWPLSEKEFWAKMAEDMDFFFKWGDIETPTKKWTDIFRPKEIKNYLSKLIN